MFKLWSSIRRAATPALEEAPLENAVPCRHGRRMLLAVFALAVVIRLAFFAAACHNGGGMGFVHVANTDTYLQPAKSLLATGSFAIDGTPELFRTPGYPLLLAVGLSTGHAELFIFAVQLLMSLATVWLIYDITLSVTNRQAAALGAALLASLEPLSIIFSTLMMSEALFTFLFMLSLQRLLRYLASESAVPLLQTALLLAIATFVRPVAYYLPTILAGLLLAHALWRSTARRRAACYAATFWLVSMTPLVAWQVRNYVETGYTAFSSVPDYNLWYYHGASIIAYQRGEPIETIQDEMGFNSPALFAQNHPQLDPADQSAKFHYMHDEGKRVMRENPLTFLRTYLRGLAILLVNPGACEVLTPLHSYPTGRVPRPINMSLIGLARDMLVTAPRLFYTNLVLLAGLAVAYLTAAVGLGSQLRRLSSPAIILATTALYFFAVSGGAQASTRLRHPIMPLVFILSGAGLAQLAAWRQRATARQMSAEVIGPLAHRPAA
jgi:hypothetical protein